MVRRRARTTKTATVNNSVLLEDSFIASPKRKDCKVENGVSKGDPIATAAALAAALPVVEHKVKTRNRTLNGKNGIVKTEDLSGKSIDNPFTTRFQTKTIENFFKTNVGTKYMNITEADKSNLNGIKSNKSLLTPSFSSTHRQYGLDDDLQLEDIIDEHAAVQALHQISHATSKLQQANGTAFTTPPPHPNLIFGFIEEDATKNNIFLQEPVLKLDIDKTPNQASSITIKKSIEAEPVFSLPPQLTATRFNGCCSILNANNQMFSLDPSFASKPINLPDNDNSSCDSGIAFVTSMSASAALDNINIKCALEESTTATELQTQTRRRKPATPHRIVCPSPTKARALPDNGHSSTVGTGGGHGLSTGRSLITASKEQLSPRKSQRHAVIAANTKTRRRLNQPEDKSPYKTTAPKSDDTTMSTNDKQINHLPFGSSDSHVQQNENSKNAASEIIEKTTIPPQPLNLTVKAHIAATKSKSVVTKAQQLKTNRTNKTSQPLANTNCNRELTEFFPVRRSVRKTKTAVKEEMMKNLEQAILEERAEGLKVAHFEGKGRGIVADRRFQRGEFVVEYEGDLISMGQATEREKRYALDENAGCYMYYFKHKNQQYCIDATVDTGKMGRLVNHSRNGNLITKVVVVKQRPHLILIAKDDIESGEELTYDYGDRSKESLLHHPWLAF